MLLPSTSRAWIEGWGMQVQSLERRTYRLLNIDLILVVGVAGLVILGLVMVKSASYGFALGEGSVYEGQPDYFLNRQAVFAAMGTAIAIGLTLIDYRYWKRWALWIMVASVSMLVGVLVLAYVKGDVGETARWLLKGSIQPVEVARIGVMIYIAAWVASRREQLQTTLPGLFAFGLVLGGVAGLVLLQPDFSTTLILIITATLMFFAGGATVKQMLILVVTGLPVAYLMVRMEPYRYDRLLTWLDGPFSDPTGEGLQLVQALIALNRGGLFGVGLGQSEQKFAVYAPHTDSIFAIIGEELGLVGGVVVVALYVLCTWRGLRIAWHAPDTYGRLLAIGLTVWISVQAIIHMGVITASVPFTGTVLPLVSYGGSSLVTTMAGVGLLLSISRHSGESEAEGAA